MTRDDEESHVEALKAFGLATDVRRRLVAYLDILALWGRRVNLSGAQTAQERVAVLLAPVLPVGSHVRAGRLVDVGSGNGSPGLVLALLRPDLDVVLLEPRMKRWAFLREAARAAGRPEIEVLRTRYQDYVGPAAETVTVRALTVGLRDLRRMVRAGGEVIIFGVAPDSEPGFNKEATPSGWGRDIHLFRHGGAVGLPQESLSAAVDAQAHVEPPADRGNDVPRET